MEANKLVLEAIATRQCLAATYNRQAIVLAPMILYTRHDELHVDAVTLERDGQPVVQPRLGTFKLAGLRIDAVAPAKRDVSGFFNPADEKYRDVTLFAIEPGR